MSNTAPSAASPRDDVDVINVVSRLVHSSLELQDVLDRSVEAAVFAVGAERGFLLLLAPDGAREIAASINISAREVESDDAQYSKTALREAERLGAAFVTNDATAEPGLSQAISVHRRRLHAIACVPMRRAERIVGFLYVDTRNRLGGFSARDVRLLEIVGDMSSTAIERAMLVRTLCHQERLAGLGALTANIAHELNSPLANILACFELLQPAVAASGLADLEVVGAEARRCATIVKSLLSLARTQTLRPEAVDVVDVARRALQLRRARLHASSIKVTEVLAGPVIVKGEPELLLQVVLNLVVNAEQAMEAVPATARVLTVSATVDAAAKEVELVVDDSGPGVPEADRGHVFDPFFTTKSSGVGTGLGLSICAGIIRSHAGAISVAASPTGGASFRVRLPLGVGPSEP
jgi:signal transduction histidine kinase